MSTWTHCDGPNCKEQLSESDRARTWGVTGWAEVEIGTESLHFHKVSCLAEWSAAKSTKPNVVPIRGAQS